MNEVARVHAIMQKSNFMLSLYLRKKMFVSALISIYTNELQVEKVRLMIYSTNFQILNP